MHELHSNHRRAARLVLLAALTLLPPATTELPAQESLASIEDFAWIEGSWLGQMDVGGSMADAENYYMRPAANMIVGVFRLTRGSSFMVTELLSLAEEDGNLVLRIRHFDRQLTPWETEGPITLHLESVEGEVYRFRNHESEQPEVVIPGAPGARPFPCPLRDLPRYRRADGHRDRLSAAVTDCSPADSGRSVRRQGLVHTN